MDERTPKYMIHACPSREWYVNDFLIPSMIEQGIPREDIEVWMDRNGDGCLMSCMNAFAECGNRDDGGGRWHLQDDVVLSHYFRTATTQNDDGIVCGYVFRNWQALPVWDGTVPGSYLWNSFPCIRIPDKIAGECAEWFFADAAYRDEYQHWIQKRKGDDTVFFDFFMENYADKMFVVGLNPCIVDHIDYLIGGSVVNKDRGAQTRALFWDDHGEIDALKYKLAHR